MDNKNPKRDDTLNYTINPTVIPIKSHSEINLPPVKREWI